jgi:hypothetical protein
VNGPANSIVAAKYDVVSYPTIVLVNGSIKVYKGNRSYDDLKRFVKLSRAV